jgi:hypothetical protein
MVWHKRVVRSTIAVTVLAALAVVLAQAQPLRGGRSSSSGFEFAERSEAEFHFGRLAYSTSRYAGSRGIANPMWAVDWPLAEQHFLPAFARYTRIDTAPDSGIVTLDNDTIFQFPWVLIQQVSQGNWSPTPAEGERLREYLLRGGFVLFDDFHGQDEWQYFEYLMGAIVPGRRIVDIPEDHAIMNILFVLDQSIQIPGERHLRGGLRGPTTWRGIYDDEDRLMVGIAFNADMGDAWEHADDPGYPTEMTGQAYRFGTNFVIYAMTH